MKDTTELVKKGLIHRESQYQCINSFLENESNSGESNNQGSSGFQGSNDLFPALHEFSENSYRKYCC